MNKKDANLKEVSEFSIKPKATVTAVALRFSILIIIPIAFVSFFLLTAKESEIQLLPVLLIITSIWFFLWLFSAGMKYMVLKHAQYHFFSDRIEYHNKLNVDISTIYYKDIKYIKVRNGIFMSIFGLGSVYIKLNKYMRLANKKLTSHTLIDMIDNSDELSSYLNSRNPT